MYDLCCFCRFSSWKKKKKKSQTLNNSIIIWKTNTTYCLVCVHLLDVTAQNKKKNYPLAYLFMVVKLQRIYAQIERTHERKH